MESRSGDIQAAYLRACELFEAGSSLVDVSEDLAVPVSVARLWQASWQIEADLEPDRDRDEGLTLLHAQYLIEQLSGELAKAQERVQQLELYLDIAVRANQRLRDHRRDELNQRLRDHRRDELN